MAAESPNFSARPEQVEGKWKSLTLAFRKCCDHNSISGNDRKECPFLYATSSSLGRRITCALRPSHKKKRTFRLTFSGIRQQAHQNSQNIRNVRSFGKRKLTNSGIYSYSGIFPNERALSYLVPLFQNESSCKTLPYLQIQENEHVGGKNFHLNGFALGLVLTQRQGQLKSGLLDNITGFVQIYELTEN